MNMKFNYLNTLDIAYSASFCGSEVSLVWNLKALVSVDAYIES